MICRHNEHAFRKKASIHIHKVTKEMEEKTFTKFLNDGRFVRQEAHEAMQEKLDK